MGDYPNETCGLILGSWEGENPHAKRLFPAKNDERANPAHRYLIDRRTYEEAERACTESGLVILGVYHSHPDSPPVPSSVDAEFAFPGWIYWITPVFERTASAPRIWYRENEAWREIGLTEQERC